MSEIPAHPTFSPRQGDILNLMAQGYRNEHVAEILGISRKRLGKHIARLYRKTGLVDRPALIRYAFEAGLAHSAGDIEADTTAALVLAYGRAPYRFYQHQSPHQSGEAQTKAEPPQVPTSEIVLVTGMPRYLAEGKVGQPVRMRQSIGDIPEGPMGTISDIGPGDHDTVGVLILGWHLPGANEPITRWIDVEEHGWGVEDVDAEGQPLSAAEQAEQEAVILANAMQQRLSTIDAMLDALQYLGTAASPQTLGNLLYVAEMQVEQAHGVLRQWLQHERAEAGGESWRSSPQRTSPEGEMAS